MKDKIIKKVNFNKGGTGGYAARIILNNEWINDMGITKENNEIELTYKQKTKESTAESKHINGSAGAAHHQCNRCKNNKDGKCGHQTPDPI